MEKKLDTSKPIAVGCDHAGFEYKQSVVKYLREAGHEVKDFGTFSSESVDFPDFAHPTSKYVEDGHAGFGILLCGSANGVAITANKHSGIRAAICWLKDIAELARKHNDANVICIPARFVSLNDALEMIDIFMNTEFEGGRHERRVEKISC